MDREEKESKSLSPSPRRPQRRRRRIAETYGTLPRANPFVGTVAHAPSAGNRGRQTFFERQLLTAEQVRRQHEVRVSPYMGIFHYGDELYGKTMEDFRHDLAARNIRLAANARRQRSRSRSGAGLMEIFPRLSDPNGSNPCSPGQAAFPGDSSTVPSLGDAFTSGEAALNGDNAGDVSGGATSTPTTAEAASAGAAASARELRRSSYTLVLYGSGDNLCKMAEKQRRRDGKSGRLKYNGAIDTSKRYPKSGSLDDCALMRPVGAERSKLYNDLTAEVNGFRRHFFLQHRLHPKEAYLQHKLRNGGPVVSRLDGLDLAQAAAAQALWEGSPFHGDPAAAGMRHRLSLEMAMAAAAAGGSSFDDPADHVGLPLWGPDDILAAGGGGGGGGGLGEGGYGAPRWLATAAAVEGEPPLPLVAEREKETPVRSMSLSRRRSSVSSSVDLDGEMEGFEVGDGGSSGNGGFVPSPAMAAALAAGAAAGWSTQQAAAYPYAPAPPAGPGATWIPQTVSAAYKKESWEKKQLKRSGAKFQPFFVHAKTDITDAYELLEHKVLGQGSYASVILATHRASGQAVAIKAVQKRLLFTEQEKKSVLQEIENQMRIIHRHVVRLEEVYETPEHLYIVLECCPCGDLEKMLYICGKLAEIEVQRVAKQLLDAVAYLHDKGIVHCDLKPQNLLFAVDDDPDNVAAHTAQSQRDEALSSFEQQDDVPLAMTITSPAGLLAKLCDFGMSVKVPDVRFYKLTGDVNKIPYTAMCGTGGYIAPEIMSQVAFGKPADLWSVGVMCYQMLCGRLPFMPARSCLRNRANLDGPTWSKVSSEAKDLIRRLLEPDPARRLTARQALDHPWIRGIGHLKPSFPHFVPAASPAPVAAALANGRK